MLERNTIGKKSRIRTAVVPNVRKHHLREQIAKHVEDGAMVYTDSMKSFQDLSLYYQHQSRRPRRTVRRWDSHERLRELLVAAEARDQRPPT